MSTPERSRDEGSALLMALVFVLVIGLVISALLTQTTTSLKTTQVVRDNADKVYAADSGLEHALESLRLDRTYCPAPGDAESLPSITSNGHTVELQCSNEGGGSSSGAEGWAVIITGTTSDSFTTQGSDERKIDGPVFGANLGDPARLVKVTNGSVLEKQSASSCSTDADKPANISISPSPPFRYRCTTAAVPDPAHNLPGSVPTPTNPPTTTSGTCQVFRPGTYTTVALASDNYFQSGTYYFRDVVLDINQTVVGGRRDPAESSIVVSDPCVAAQAADPGSGTGIKWILGGSSRLSVGPHGQLELFARQGGGSGEGQMGISLQTATSTNGFAASTVPLSTSLVAVGNGATPKLVVHGMLYAPNGYLETFATNESQANFQGGLVIRKLHLQSSASASGLVVAVSSAPGSRDMVVTATAKGQSSSRDVTATAVLELDNNAARTFKVVSWRVE